MTENEWLTSTYLAAMWKVVAPTATEMQAKHFVESCRAIFTPHRTWLSTRSWKLSAERWATDKEVYGQGDVCLPYRAELLREIFGNPFYFYYTKADRYDQLMVWDNGAIPRMTQAIYGESVTCPNCLGCGGPERCDFCNQTGRIMTAFNPTAMPLLADILEEAGVSETAILDHLRGREKCWCVKSEILIDWCSQCKCGIRPANHVRGCWALELFIQTKE
jgi:hypothetical protein